MTDAEQVAYWKCIWQEMSAQSREAIARLNEVVRSLDADLQSLNAGLQAERRRRAESERALAECQSELRELKARVERERRRRERRSCERCRQVPSVAGERFCAPCRWIVLTAGSSGWKPPKPRPRRDGDEMSPGQEVALRHLEEVDADGHGPGKSG